MVKDGYKQTEIGVIPENWEYAQFQDVLDGFTSGMTPYRGNPEYYKGNIRWITSGELNYNIIEDTHEKITLEAVKKTNLKILPKGTFLMAITGLEAEGTRGSCGLVGAEATTNQSCMALFSTEKMIVEYLYHFYVKYGNLLAFKYCQGTKQQSYTAKIVKILPIVYPPNIKEQKAIAEALSDTDRLITSFEALIEKKENIKTATMQQLLTGKKRLDGFSEEWVEKKLGDIAHIKTGNKNNEDKKEDGIYPFFVRSKNIEKIDTYSFDGEAILIPGEGGIGTIIHYINGKFDYHQRVYKISDFNKNVNGKFLFYKMMKDFNTHAISNSVKATVDSLRLPTFQDFNILMPKNKKEQKGIAQILSNMDKEIETLKEKLDKIKAIKMGMMQELLTGRTRLIGEEDNDYT